jgi:hypothetical protein
VENFEVPDAMRKGRFGVREFHHPSLVDMLVGANPDSDLGDILTAWLDVGGADFQGTAENLDSILLNSSNHRDTYRRTCGTASKLGQALGRLSRADGWRGRITWQPIRKGPNRQKQREWRVRREAEPEVGVCPG